MSEKGQAMRSGLIPILTLMTTVTVAAEETKKELAAPFMGLSLVDREAGDAILKPVATKLPSGKGVFVAGVVPYSPADEIGISSFDIIKTIDGKPVETVSEVRAIENAAAIGDVLNVSFMRSTTAANGKVSWRGVQRSKITVKSRAAAAVAAMAFSKDEVEGIIWARHKDSPESVRGLNTMLLYFQVGDDNVPHNLRAQIGYAARDWIFMKEFVFRAGEETHRIAIPLFKADTEVVTGGVREWLDFSVNKSTSDAVFSIAKPVPVTLRISGSEGNFDRELPLIERVRMQSVIDCYLANGGVPPK